MNAQTAFDILSTASLIVLAAMCLVHINEHVTRASSHCERLGFALVIGGACGQALSYWWPKIELFPVDALLHLGLALVALAMVRGDVHNLVARLKGWDGVDRRADRNRFDGTLGSP